MSQISLPSRIRGSQGYVLLLAVAGAVAVAMFGTTLLSLNQGYRSQVMHTKEMQASFQVAYSGYQRILARLFLKPWEERFFKGTPVAENGLSLQEGTYDTYVTDAPGKPNQADIYVRVVMTGSKGSGVPRNYVWRIEHVPDLLDSQYCRTIFFGEVHPDSFPSGSTPTYSDTISQLVKKRDENATSALNLAAQLVGLTDLPAITGLLGAPPANLPAGLDLPAPQSTTVPPGLTDPPPPAPASATMGDSLIAGKPKKAYPGSEKIINTVNAGKTLNLKVQFAADAATILSSSYPVLEQIYQALLTDSTLKLQIEGHTANDGTGSGFSLSQQRAETVRDWLIAKGIRPSRLRAVGYGETRPLASNVTSEGKARNRRVSLSKF